MSTVTMHEPEHAEPLPSRKTPGGGDPRSHPGSLAQVTGSGSGTNGSGNHGPGNANGSGNFNGSSIYLP
jgi:hypothetical protein